MHRDARAMRRGVGIEGAALANPFGENRVRRVVRAQPQAAAMRGLHRRLAQEQARRGFDDVDAATEDVAHERELVGLDIERAERQRESALATGRAVAAAGIAALLAQRRERAVFETHRFRRGLIRDRDGHARLASADLREQFRFAFAQRRNPTAAHRRDARNRKLERRRAREILHRAIRVNTRDNHLRALLRATEHDACGMHFEPHGRADDDGFKWRGLGFGGGFFRSENGKRENAENEQRDDDHGGARQRRPGSARGPRAVFGGSPKTSFH